MSAIEKYKQPQSLSEIERLASHFASSGLFGNSPKTQGEIIVKMLAGAENGIPPFASVQGIHVIQGKPEMGADLLARAVKQSERYDYKVRHLDDEACVLEFFEAGESIGVSEFSMRNAKTAGISNAMYGKYPRNMLFARAMSNGVSWYCPDATSTRFYVDGEISAPRPVENETVIHEVIVEPDAFLTPEHPLRTNPDEIRLGEILDRPARVPEQPVEPSPPAMGEPERIVADQLAAIGSEGRKRLKAHMRALDCVVGDQRKPETWVDAIITNWSEEWDSGGPMYTDLAKVLAALDEMQRIDTPVMRRDEEDAAFDAEADALFQKTNGPDVRSLPMYGQQAPS